MKDTILRRLTLIGLGLLLSIPFLLPVRGEAQNEGGPAGPNGKTGAAERKRSGVEIFNVHCRSCHGWGGNLLDPEMPLRGAPQLAKGDENPTLWFLCYSEME